MFSLNYMFEGADKTWYIVPASYKDLMKIYAQKIDKLDELEGVNLTINPYDLVKNNVINLFRLLFIKQFKNLENIF